MTTIKGFTESQLAAAFEASSPEVRVFEFIQKNNYATAHMLRDQAGVSLSTARRVLWNLEDEGKVESRETTLDGRRTTVYRLKTNERSKRR